MIEVLKHIFVLLLTPAALIATTHYAVCRRQFLLGTLATLGVWALCFVAASAMFDGYLLVYSLLFAAQLLIPAGMLLATLISGAGKAKRVLDQKRRAGRVL